MPKKLPTTKSTRKAVKVTKKNTAKKKLPIKPSPKKTYFLGPLVAILAIILILLSAKMFSGFKTTLTSKPINKPTTTETTPSAVTTPKVSLPTLGEPTTLPVGWEEVNTAINGEKTTTYYVSPNDNKSVIYLGSRFSLHETGNICGGEPPCIEYGKFDAKVGGKAYTTPLFLSRNRQTGENKYIFQFRLYGFEGATYVSGKVTEEKYLEDIKVFLATFPTE